jgi:hypothetical protein
MNHYKTTPKVKQITGTRKREFALLDKGWAVNTGSYWSGGTKYDFLVWNIRTGQQKNPPAGEYPTFKSEYTPGENEILIQTGVSCGKPSTPYIHCRPEDKENVLKWLGVK